jgi:hypothetical protein
MMTIKERCKIIYTNLKKEIYTVSLFIVKGCSKHIKIQIVQEMDRGTKRHHDERFYGP